MTILDVVFARYTRFIIICAIIYYYIYIIFYILSFIGFSVVTFSRPMDELLILGILLVAKEGWLHRWLMGDYT